MKNNLFSKLNQYYYYKFNNTKNKNNNISLKYCINCNKKGGVIFTGGKGFLIAKCGNLNNNCDLNIMITNKPFNNKPFFKSFI